MRVLFYVSKEIGGDDILYGLFEAGVDADRSDLRVDLDEIDEEQVETIIEEVRKYDVIITRSFSVNVAEGCHIAGVPYIAWCYDSPVRALYRKESLYPTNRIFVFDRKQLERLRKLGIDNVFYQPLAANMIKASLVSVSDADLDKYARDVSFIGRMYDKGFFEIFMRDMDEKIRNECEDLLNRYLCRWPGDEVIFDRLSDGSIAVLYEKVSKAERELYSLSDRYLTELLVLVPELTFRDRIKLTDEAGKRFRTIVHTYAPEDHRDETSALLLPPVGELSEELYRIYASAKINLNLTMRSIESGVPQRVFDIMSVGGCVFSNYQEEAEDLFEPDKEIILFKSVDEFVDKADYYLTHEKERLEICARGYLKVKNEYNYPIAIKNMLNRV